MTFGMNFYLALEVGSIHMMMWLNSSWGEKWLCTYLVVAMRLKRKKKKEKNVKRKRKEKKKRKSFEKNKRKEKQIIVLISIVIGLRNMWIRKKFNRDFVA